MFLRIFFALFLTLSFSPTLWAFDDLSNQWTVDLLYHYSRTERATLLTSENILSRQGGMLQFEYEDSFDLFWSWYIGGDFTFANYEASASTTVTPAQRSPWQLYTGTSFQIGARKNFEIFFGLGGSSEHFLRAESATRYSFEQKNSLRGHLGFHWRFLSVIGSSAKLTFKYSTPLMTVQHDTAGDLKYAGILDGTLRLRPYYDSTLSLYGGVRFEDYNTASGSITYFTSRLYAGIGIHF